MWPFRKRYKVTFGWYMQGHSYYIWDGGKIVASGYEFRDPVDAANAANLKREQLREADRLIRAND